MHEIERVENELLTELKVFHGLFGMRPAQHLGWARHAISPPEYVDYYATSWRVGRRLAWQRILRLGERLRALAREDEDTFALRLHRLEMVSGVDAQEVRPSTQSTLLDLRGPRQGGFHAAPHDAVARGAEHGTPTPSTTPAALRAERDPR